MRRLGGSAQSCTYLMCLITSIPTYLSAHICPGLERALRQSLSGDDFGRTCGYPARVSVRLPATPRQINDVTRPSALKTRTVFRVVRRGWKWIDLQGRIRDDFGGRSAGFPGVGVGRGRCTAARGIGGCVGEPDVFPIKCGGRVTRSGGGRRG